MRHALLCVAELAEIFLLLLGLGLALGLASLLFDFN